MKLFELFIFKLKPKSKMALCTELVAEVGRLEVGGRPSPCAGMGWSARAL